MTTPAALRATARPLLLLAGVVGAGLILRLLPDGGAAHWLDIASLKDDNPSSWMGHAAALVGIGSALCAVGVPRQIVCYACGEAFGGGLGLVLAMAAQLFGCAADVMWARLLAREWSARRLRGRLARLDTRLAARPFICTLSIRLLPVGSNLLLNLAAGLSTIRLAPFLAASALGYLPQATVFTLAGAGVRVGQPAQLALAAALLLASAGIGVVLLRRPLSADAVRAAARPG